MPTANKSWTKEEIETIKEMVGNDIQYVQIAKHFNVTRNAIAGIVNRHVYAASPTQRGNRSLIRVAAQKTLSIKKHECIYCFKEFKTKNATIQKFCSHDCSYHFHLEERQKPSTNREDRKNFLVPPSNAKKCNLRCGNVAVPNHARCYDHAYAVAA
jgi:hypothetical protein